MRCIPFIVLGLLLAAAPAFASPVLQDTTESGEPRGERWDDRWQGRNHWLYDDIARDAATDGHDAKAQANCRNVAVRVKRSDGAFAICWIRRCD